MPRRGLSCPQESSSFWTKYADGKLPFRSLRFMGAMLERKEKVVQEFWRLLAICHTVMVQGTDGERCPGPPGTGPCPKPRLPWPWGTLVPGLQRALSPSWEGKVIQAATQVPTLLCGA